MNLRFNLESCHRSLLPLAAAVGLVTVFLPLPSRAQLAAAGDWIDTWTASPQPIWDAEFFVPINVPRSVRNQTVRQIAALSIGGNRVRVVLSNEYGSKPLVIGAAHIALAGSGGSIVEGSDHPLSFDGPVLVLTADGRDAIYSFNSLSVRS